MRTVDLQEQEIFLEALEIPSSVARLDYIYQACAGNVGLRNRVQQLLALQDGNHCILDKEISLDRDGNITTDEDHTADLTGQTVGRYHLVRLLGSGGMGDVYLAEQKEPIRRRVAVKVIKLGLDTKSFVTRFSAERQALAVMDHRGITKVFDAGATQTGRPFFVMELVSGDPITVFCDDQRLRINDRLSIFRELCHAIQHAHQKGLIHRDLKPSNILVTRRDGEFLSKVIDFGVSKATHDRVAGQTDLTKLACMIGTPEYMSPEQTDTQGNDQDIRTDIYSLGAILFELITGSTPFELEDLKSKNLFSIREIIQTRSVESPSSRLSKMVDHKPQVFRNRDLTHKELQDELKGNLDAITLKCLSKDRSERYASVAELAADLERHLRGDSIAIIRQPIFSYYRRQFRKHKWILIASATFAALLITVSIFSLWAASRANRLAAQAIETQSLSEQRFNELVNARQDAQIEKARSRSFEKQYKALNRQSQNEDAHLQAISDLNRLKQKTAEDITISKWLRNQLPKKEISNLLPVSKPGSGHTNDMVLLKLILERQRETFDGTDPLVAKTLDLLGQQLLNSHNSVDAIAALQESLYIHTENDRDSEDRVRTMILLTKALKLAGRTTESDSQMETVRRYLDRLPSTSRLHKMVEELEQP